MANKSIIPEILQKHEGEILEEWISILKGGRGKTGRLKEGELETQAHDVLGALRTATEGGVDNDVTSERYGALREILGRHFALARSSIVHAVRNSHVCALAQRADFQSAREVDQRCGVASQRGLVLDLAD